MNYLFLHTSTQIKTHQDFLCAYNHSDTMYHIRHMQNYYQYIFSHKYHTATLFFCVFFFFFWLFLFLSTLSLFFFFVQGHMRSLQISNFSLLSCLVDVLALGVGFTSLCVSLGSDSSSSLCKMGKFSQSAKTFESTILSEFNIFRFKSLPMSFLSILL